MCLIFLKEVFVSLNHGRETQNVAQRAPIQPLFCTDPHLSTVLCLISKKDLSPHITAADRICSDLYLQSVFDMKGATTGFMFPFRILFATEEFFNCKKESQKEYKDDLILN